MPRFKKGDLVLCFKRAFGGQQLEALARAECIEKVGSSFYSLATGGYSRREKFEKLESRSLKIPQNSPWDFPEDFTAFFYLLPIVYRDELWSIYEVGHPYVRRFDSFVEPVSGESYRLPSDYGFSACGYAVRHFNRSGDDSWYWLTTKTAVLVKLEDDFMLSEKSSTSEEARTPEYLEETGKEQWPGASRSADAAVLRPGDIFCEGNAFTGFEFFTVERFTKSGKLITTQMRPERDLSPVPLPTAFPPDVLTRIGTIGRFQLFDEVCIWVAQKSMWSGGSDSGCTIGAIVGRWDDEAALYYSNDRIRWWRRLSRALECELDRLRFVYPGGIPGVQ